MKKLTSLLCKCHAVSKSGIKSKGRKKIILVLWSTYSLKINDFSCHLSIILICTVIFFAVLSLLRAKKDKLETQKKILRYFAFSQRSLIETELWTFCLLIRLHGDNQFSWRCCSLTHHQFLPKMECCNYKICFSGQKTREDTFYFQNYELKSVP